MPGVALDPVLVHLMAFQKMLDHADIATSQIYTHVLDDRLKALVRDAHPLADIPVNGRERRRR